MFKVKNVGAVGYDFSITDKKTPIVADGAARTLTVTTPKTGKYLFTCKGPDHAAAGRKGVLVVR